MTRPKIIVAANHNRALREAKDLGLKRDEYVIADSTRVVEGRIFAPSDVIYVGEWRRRVDHIRIAEALARNIAKSGLYKEERR